MRSNRKNKKYKAIINNKKTVHFGDSRYEDYTQHHDKKRRERYIKRHKREDWTLKGIKSAGFWAKWILWGPHKNIKDNIRHLNRKYKTISIKYR